jgi:hypothetical protein
MSERRIDAEIEERVQVLKARDDKGSAVQETLSKVETAIDKQSEVLVKLISFLAEKRYINTTNVTRCCQIC